MADVAPQVSQEMTGRHMRTGSIRNSTTMAVSLLLGGLLVGSCTLFHDLELVEPSTPDTATDLQVTDSAEDPGRDASADTTSDLCPPGFVLIEANEYDMGSLGGEDGRDPDEALHTVNLTLDFCLQAKELTQGEWTALGFPNPSSFPDCDECPVETLNWYEAIAYANAISSAMRLDPCYDVSESTGTPGAGCGDVDLVCAGGFTYTSVELTSNDCTGFRLPTEAEWELAIRAGTSTAWYCGDNSSCTTEIAWHLLNSDSRTHAAGTLDANDWGLYDMSGNVWEWVWDRYGEEYYESSPSDDPQGPESGDNRVARGGAFNVDCEFHCRSANRESQDPVTRSHNVGFRLAKTVAQ